MKEDDLLLWEAALSKEMALWNGVKWMTAFVGMRLELISLVTVVDFKGTHELLDTICVS